MVHFLSDFFFQNLYMLGRKDSVSSWPFFFFFFFFEIGKPINLKVDHNQRNLTSFCRFHLGIDGAEKYNKKRVWW